MILEGIVTTLDENATLNVAPMGPTVRADFQQFVFRPFRTSTTYKNLSRSGEGVFHVTEDVLLLARSTIGKVSDVPSRIAEFVSGRVLLECCRYYEFRVTDVDDRGERVSFTAVTVQQGTFRECFGFNRARHAVLETAILASRIEFLPIDGLGSELHTHRAVVEKTGDAPEFEAFALLDNYIRSTCQRRGLYLESPE